MAETNIVVGLVEDEPVQAELYEAMLSASGMRVERFSNALEFQRRNGASCIDVLLLDWNLPQVSGIELLRKLRSEPSYLPIILLTANDAEQDVVYGLKCGADDYVVKPPRPHELSARVSNAYRRSRPEAGAERIEAPPFVFDVSNRELWLNDQLHQVTEKEFDLLVYLFRRRERIVSRQMLLRDVWKVGPEVNTRSVDTYVSRLRKSLGLDGESGWKLAGVYQHGYRLTPIGNGEEHQ